jgi:hypothetical protein
MTPLDPKAESFLLAIKAAGRSAPAGMHWHAQDES